MRDGATLPALLCWLVIAPVVVFGLLDRIVFDGSVLRRRGPVAALLGLVTGKRQVLSIGDIETITTDITSLSVGGGDSRLRYHTVIGGRGIEILIRSNRANYGVLIKALFRAVGPNKLDSRSYELFEYFDREAAHKNVPVLRNEIAAMPVPILRRVANALRLEGRLSQASSYFRTAYEKEPRNPELLYEMSRFFHSSARSTDGRLIQRSDACLRLAARLAGSEPGLLERIGEAFFERLDYKRAADCFQRATALDPSRFRANVGLAEIALRDGKLAHVAHFYNAAAGSSDVALSRLAQREAKYYHRLMTDDDFLASELRRLRVSNQIGWARRLAAITFLGGLMVAVTSMVVGFAAVIEDLAWSVMGASGIVWVASSVSLYLFRRRH
jgi:tetratricopeptide (TPR) repeat protein